MDIETKYDISELKEIARCYDNDLTRKTNEEVDNILEILHIIYNDSTKREITQEAVRICESIRKELNHHQITPRAMNILVDGIEYALSIIYEDYDILIHANVALNLETIEFTICVKVNEERHTITKTINMSEFEEKGSNLFLDLIVKVYKKIKENHGIKPTTDDNTLNTDKPLKPLKCPCCNGNITNRTKCEYCGTLFE